MHKCGINNARELYSYVTFAVALEAFGILLKRLKVEFMTA